MSFYDDMAGVALELIAEFGQGVILREAIPGEYDPETGQTAPDQTREQIGQGIMADFSGLEFQNNSLIKQGDKKLKLAASGLEWAPSLMSKVVVQGVSWTIVPPLKEINPAGTPLLYELQVRL
ncbi:hypothetical protein FJD38_22730 [Pseudomonas saxonica]|uniref:Phage tail protein n=1 Tax=Pseudomonas saxonica TaxID=2600598 RepID=A0ABY3GBM1_9PSED|nr:hypothetical protein [Pseudomonas saxonica]TWR85101.1 hypothetical protein FJD38_22730 [Pseudomonas saxonica]